MRIEGKPPVEGKNPAEVSNLYELQKIKSPPSKKTNEKSEVLEVSLEANQIKILAQKAKEMTTAFRHEDAEKTKELLEKGEYRIELEALAKKLLEETQG